MLHDSKDPQWVWSRRPGGVKYRLHLLNSVEKLWELEVASIADPSLITRFGIPASAVQAGDFTPYLQQALFEFVRMNDERAEQERERRLARRRAEFDRAVQEGSFREPEGAPETTRGGAPSESAGDGGDREHLFAPDQEDRGASAERGVQDEPKAPARKTRASGSRRRGSKGRKASSSDSDRGSEAAAKA